MANTVSEEPASAMDEAKDKGILSGTNLEHDEAEVTAPVSPAAGSSAPGGGAGELSIPAGSSATSCTSDRILSSSSDFNPRRKQCNSSCITSSGIISSWRRSRRIVNSSRIISY
ncbi:uncharacterized protein LOC115926581 [Strongylocentrotus purpuratus]|nr:uncharacterized protein LOC115926581 [Strongylocentrotus purpuratus]